VKKDPTGKGECELGGDIERTLHRVFTENSERGDSVDGCSLCAGNEGGKQKQRETRRGQRRLTHNLKKPAHRKSSSLGLRSGEHLLDDFPSLIWEKKSRWGRSLEVIKCRLKRRIERSLTREVKGILRRNSREELMASKKKTKRVKTRPHPKSLEKRNWQSQKLRALIFREWAPVDILVWCPKLDQREALNKSGKEFEVPYGLITHTIRVTPRCKVTGRAF